MRIQNSQSGFSLLEILVAMAIMAILGGIMAVQFIGKTTEASLLRVKGDISNLETALIRYNLDNFMLPTTEQGLEALVSKPINSPLSMGRDEHSWYQGFALGPEASNLVSIHSAPLETASI